MSEAKGHKTITVSMQYEIANEFEKRADSLHLFSDEYCGLILTDWLSSDKQLELLEQ